MTFITQISGKIFIFILFYYYFSLLFLTANFIGSITGEALPPLPPQTARLC